MHGIFANTGSTHFYGWYRRQLQPGWAPISLRKSSTALSFTSTAATIGIAAHEVHQLAVERTLFVNRIECTTSLGHPGVFHSLDAGTGFADHLQNTADVVVLTASGLTWSM